VKRFKYPDNVAIVSCGSAYTSVITKSNKVFLWGAGGESIPTEKAFFSEKRMYPRAVTAGQNHIAVVTKEHEVFTWGSNGLGQLGWSDDDTLFTLEPHLVEDLIGKNINMIAAGTNHTIALAGKPAPISCPVFQDWYGSPTGKNDEFEAVCHKEDETCPDHSCCSKGESCTQFDDGKWGCCLGTNMRIVEDQLTCCPKDTTFNSADRTCEQEVSFVEAAMVFKALEDGFLVQLPQIPVVSEDETQITTEGSELHIVGVQPSEIGTTVGMASEISYKKSGLAAGSEAAVNEYHKLAADVAINPAPANTNTNANDVPAAASQKNTGQSTTLPATTEVPIESTSSAISNPAPKSSGTGSNAGTGSGSGSGSSPAQVEVGLDEDGEEAEAPLTADDIAMIKQLHDQASITSTDDKTQGKHINS
jgi:hypothetical protein